jgi:hypothetical protein
VHVGGQPMSYIYASIAGGLVASSSVLGQVRPRRCYLLLIMNFAEFRVHARTDAQSEKTGPTDSQNPRG